eukprot:scaffold1036_cov343-Prasinococcus_capsulatus_cf.AAC.5
MIAIPLHSTFLIPATIPVPNLTRQPGRLARAHACQLHTAARPTSTISLERLLKTASPGAEPALPVSKPSLGRDSAGAVSSCVTLALSGEFALTS